MSNINKKYVLSSHELILRDYLDCDFANLNTLRSNTFIQHLLLSHPLDYQGTEATSDWIRRRLTEPDAIFKVLDFCGLTVGFAQISRVHKIDRYGYLGIAVLPEFHNRGIGREAILRLLKIAKSKELRKLIIEVRADNENALYLYNSAGFRLIGRLIDHYSDGTILFDVILLEIALRDQ